MNRVKWETDQSESYRAKLIYDFGTDIAPERLNYVYIYTALIAVVLYLVFQRALALFYFCLKASRRIHEKLFHGITRAQMYFFNTNSSGRIINRFSKDMNDIDYYLPTVLYDSMLVSVFLVRKIEPFFQRFLMNVFFTVFITSNNIIDSGFHGKLLVNDSDRFHVHHLFGITAHICENRQMS